MGRTMKRLTSVLLSTAMLLSSAQAVLAAKVDEFVDFPTGWSRPAMESAVDNGLLSGFGNGEIKPKNNLTRAEMATIMAQAFGAVNMADLSAYKDVPYDAWYYEPIAKAVQMGALTGKSETEMCPDCNITREEVFSVIARILALSDEDTSVLSKFSDAGEVSSWASSALAAMVKRGYVNGDDFGRLNPKSYITREEFAQVMYMTIKRYITTPGTYNEDMQGIVVLRTGNVALTSMSVNGDLVVGDGASRLAVKLTNVNVNGRLLTRGGTMTLKNTTVADGVVVFNPNGITHFNNYRTEAVFDGIKELTKASFLSGSAISSGGSSSSGSVSYYVTFKLDDGASDNYAKISVKKGKKIDDEMPKDPSRLGYTFDGWYDQNGEEVTKDTVVKGTMTVTARFARVDYPISYKNDDNTAFSYFISGYTPANTYNIEETYTLPTADKVYRKGYTFNGWVDAKGSPVTKVEVTKKTTAEGLTLYASFTANEYTLFFDADFVSGEHGMTKTYTIEDYKTFVFPTASEVKVPADKQAFLGWYLNDTEITALDESFITDEVGTITLVAKFSDKVTPPSPTSCMVTFKLNADDTLSYEQFYVESGEKIGDKLPKDPSKKGYTFEGWYDGSTKITAETVVSSDITAVAKFTINEYTLRFEADFKDGASYKDVKYTVENYTTVVFPTEADLVIPEGKKSLLGWYLNDAEITALDESFITDEVGTITLTPKFSDKVTPPSPTTYMVTFKLNADDTPPYYATCDIVKGEKVGDRMPTAPTKKGYTFVGWYDGSTEITENTVVNGNITAVAKFRINEYTLRFKADFKDGASYKDVKYTIENYATVVFPTEAELVIPEGKDEFLGWYNLATKVTALDESYITDTVGVITLTALFKDKTPEPGVKTIDVTFYLGYDKSGANEMHLDMYDTTLELDSTGVAHITESKLPDLGNGDAVFKKSWYMPTSYPDYNGVYYVPRTFWYEVDGKLVPFNTSVDLAKDTKVHIMYQNFAFNARLDAIGLPAAAIATNYTDESRLIDSAKVMGHNGVKWIEMAQKYPKYTDLTGAAYDKLADLNIIDENKNIKMLYIPISISAFTTKEVANGMVKARIRDMIADPAQLDTLLGMVDIDDLVKYIDKDDVIAGLTDAQIATLMTADENRATVTSFILKDLQSKNSVLMDKVLDYVSKSLATDDALRNKLAAELKTKLAGGDKSAKELRELILKSDSLETLLENDAIKAEVIDLILDTKSGVIDEILDDSALAKQLIGELAKNDSFVKKVIETTEFKNYVLPLIRKDGAEYDKVTDVILKSETAKREILNAVEANEDFKQLLKTNQELRDELLNSITVDDVDEILKYVFDIDGHKDYSDIMTQTEIDAYFDEIPSFADLAERFGNNRKAAKSYMYNYDVSVVSAAKTEISSKVDTYKKNALDSFINGTLTDSTLKGVIEEKMLDYVRRYVDKEPLNTELEELIENEILTYVSGLITGPTPADTTLAGVQTELKNSVDAYIGELHNKTGMKDFVKSFIAGSDEAEMKTLVSGMYTDLVPTMAVYIKGLDTSSANYKAIDKALKNAASSIDTSVLAEFIKTYATDSTVRALLKDYIADKANENSIKAYVDGYIDTIDAQFVADNRDFIDKVLASFDIDELIGNDPDAVAALVKDYINSLSASEKTALADKLYKSISATPEYKGLLDNIFDDDIIEITDSNLALVTVLSHAIRALTFDDAVDFTHNAYVEKVVNLLGKDFISDRFEETRDNYCDGLDDAAARVSSGASAKEEYTTSLSFRVNPIKDVLVKLYDKAQPIVEKKLSNANVRYDDNDYLKYIVEHDVIARLVNVSGVETDELTGYALRSEVDYASYMMELLIAADDAICWYGDNLTDEQLEAVCDAVFAKVQTVHKKLNELLEDYVATGDVPAKLQQVLDKVQKLNDIFVAYEPKLKNVIEKYLANDINDKIQNGTITDDERFTAAVEILLGKDDPVFTIDCLYDLFYKYDDKLQAKLKEFVDSGKLKAAIDKALDKAESTGSVSSKVDLDKLEKLADELYAIIVKLAENGVEPFRVNTDDDATIIDKYELELGGNVFTMTRELQ